MSASVSKGFTIVETLVVVTVCGLLITLLFGPLSELFTSNTRSLTSVVQTSDIKTALRQVEKSSALGLLFMPQSYPDSSSTSWRWNSSTGLLSNPLIIASNATERNSSNDRALAYNNTPSCLQLPVNMTYATMFFVRDSTLYRRIIPPPAPATCSGNAIEQKMTCADPTLNPSACGASDAVLLKGVTEFSLAYYESSNSPASSVPSSDNALLSYRSVVVTVKTTVGKGGAMTTATNSLRISLINA